MSGLLTLLIVALAASAVAALAVAVVLLRRQGRLDAGRLAATGALAAITVASAVLGIASLSPVPAPAPGTEPVSAVTVVEKSPAVQVDVQLPTLALDE